MTPAEMALHATLIRSMRAIATAWENWLKEQELVDDRAPQRRNGAADSRVSTPTPDTRQRIEPANASPVKDHDRRQ